MVSKNMVALHSPGKSDNNCSGFHHRKPLFTFNIDI